MQELSSETVCLRVALSQSASSYKVVALTEGGDGEFFVTLRRTSAAGLMPVGW